LGRTVLVVAAARVLVVPMVALEAALTMMEVEVAERRR
jgi:hypothetical protein